MTETSSDSSLPSLPSWLSGWCWGILIILSVNVAGPSELMGQVHCDRKGQLLGYHSRWDAQLY